MITIKIAKIDPVNDEAYRLWGDKALKVVTNKGDYSLVACEVDNFMEYEGLGVNSILRFSWGKAQEWQIVRSATLEEAEEYCKGEVIFTLPSEWEQVSRSIEEKKVDPKNFCGRRVIFKDKEFFVHSWGHCTRRWIVFRTRADAEKYKAEVGSIALRAIRFNAELPPEFL
jgi:hypothetical protein